MAPVSIVFGLALIVLGVASFLGTAGDQYHPTALIPAYFGLPLLLLGLVALKESLRKHAMHLASAIGLIGFLIPAVMALPKVPALINGDPNIRRNAVLEQLAMAAICLVFTLLCVRSFVVARLRRAQNQPASQA